MRHKGIELDEAETHNQKDGDKILTTSASDNSHLNHAQGTFVNKLSTSNDAAVPSDKGSLGMRHVLCLLCFLALAVSYMNRINLSIAIVAMVHSNNNRTNEEGDICPLPGTDNNTIVDTTEGPFDWDEETQGIVLSSFFYGYTFGNFLGGLAAERFGGRMTVGVTVIVTSLLSMISPICSRTSIGLFVTVRALSGLVQGALYPGVFVLMAAWVPSEEKSSLSSFVFIGNHIGTVVTMSLGGVLAASDFLGGWPSIFYVFGVVGMLWSIPWFLLVRDRPDEHPFISPDELNYIKTNSSAISAAEAVKIPWKKIFTSAPVWSLIIYSFGDGISFFTLLTEIPTYLRNIQHYDLASNGLLSSLPYVGIIIFSPIYGVFANWLSTKGLMTTTGIRKLSTAVAHYGSGLSLVAMCFVNCNATLAIVFLILSVSINGADYSGAFISEQDLAPNFAGLLKGIINAVSGITGIIAPLMTGVITSGNETLSAWRTVFAIAAACYFIPSTIFVIFGTAEVQPWNEPKKKKDDKIVITADMIDNF